MYISLYRRYRPQTFSDVVGQTAAIGVITRAIENGTIGHAYLFSGPRGCGKTTIARLFAKAVNCPNRKGAEPCNECESCRAILDGSCLDVIEIDGASNNGVDQIRDLKERVALATFTCPYKIYIIDEVHMLSVPAFNALLKTLEEPPDRVVFILATTAPQKVPVTIRSRCQHIPFHGMTTDQIVSRLKHVASCEKLRAEDEALWEIARNSEGGMRDALSLMEQTIAYGTGCVTRETVDKLLGGGTSGSVRKWLSLCHEKPEEALPALEALFRTGAEQERFLTVLFVLVRNLWLQARWGGNVLSSVSLSDDEKKWFASEKSFLGAERLERLMGQIASLLPQVRRGISNDVVSGLLVGWLLGSIGQPVATAPPAQKFSPPTRGGQAFSEPLAARKAPVAGFNVPEMSADGTPPRAIDFLPGVVRSELHGAPSQAVPAPKADEFSATHPEVSRHAFGSPSAPPSVTETVYAGEALKKALLEKMADDPQTVMPLLLSDVAFDAETGRLTLNLDPSDGMAFEFLCEERARRHAAAIIAACGRIATSLELFCGARHELYGGLEEHETPVSVGTESAPTPLSTADVGDARRETIAAAPFSPDKTNVGTVPVQPASDPEAAVMSLVEYLRDFTEGELLYCRPNADSEDVSEEES